MQVARIPFLPQNLHRGRSIIPAKEQTHRFSAVPKIDAYFGSSSSRADSAIDRSPERSRRFGTISIRPSPGKRANRTSEIAPDRGAADVRYATNRGLSTELP